LSKIKAFAFVYRLTAAPIFSLALQAAEKLKHISLRKYALTFNSKGLKPLAIKN
jgi:hypothetical protein